MPIVQAPRVSGDSLLSAIRDYYPPARGLTPGVKAKHPNDYIRRLLAVEATDDTLASFVKQFMAKPASFTNTLAGTAALKMEAYMVDKAPALLKTYVESILNEDGETFFVSFGKNAKKDDLENMFEALNDVATFNLEAYPGKRSEKDICEAYVYEVTAKPRDAAPDTVDDENLAVLTKGIPAVDAVGTVATGNPLKPKTAADYQRITAEGGLDDDVVGVVLSNDGIHAIDVGTEEVGAHRDENGVWWFRDNRIWTPDPKSVRLLAEANASPFELAEGVKDYKSRAPKIGMTTIESGYGTWKIDLKESGADLSLRGHTYFVPNVRRRDVLKIIEAAAVHSDKGKRDCQIEAALKHAAGRGRLLRNYDVKREAFNARESDMGVDFLSRLKRDDRLGISYLDTTPDQALLTHAGRMLRMSKENTRHPAITQRAASRLGKHAAARRVKESEDGTTVETIEFEDVHELLVDMLVESGRSVEEAGRIARFLSRGAGALRKAYKYHKDTRAFKHYIKGVRGSEARRASTTQRRNAIDGLHKLASGASTRPAPKPIISKPKVQTRLKTTTKAVSRVKVKTRPGKMIITNGRRTVALKVKTRRPKPYGYARTRLPTTPRKKRVARFESDQLLSRAMLGWARNARIAPFARIETEGYEPADSVVSEVALAVSGDFQDPVDKGAAKKLVNFIHGSKAYVAMIWRAVNLYKKRGTYREEEAHALGKTPVLLAAKKLGGAEWMKEFGPATREAAARMLVKKAEGEKGKYDETLPAKWQKGGDGEPSGEDISHIGNATETSFLHRLGVHASHLAPGWKARRSRVHRIGLLQSRVKKINRLRKRIATEEAKPDKTIEEMGFIRHLRAKLASFTGRRKKRFGIHNNALNRSVRRVQKTQIDNYNQQQKIHRHKRFAAGYHESAKPVIEKLSIKPSSFNQDALFDWVKANAPTLDVSYNTAASGQFSAVLDRKSKNPVGVLKLKGTLADVKAAVTFATKKGATQTQKESIDESQFVIGEAVTAAVVSASQPGADGQSDLVRSYSNYVRDGNVSAAVGPKVENKLDAAAFKVEQNPMNGQITFRKIRPMTDKLVRFESGVMDKVLEQIDTFWNNEAGYKQVGTIFSRGILMFGPAGSGKTSLLHMIVEQIIERGDIALYPSSVGSIRPLIAAMQQIRDVEPERKIVCVLEDADEFARYDEHSLLQLLDGESAVPGVLYVATSNYLDRLPPRMLRAGRFDLKVECGMPPDNAREAYLTAKLKNVKPAVDEATINDYVSKTDGFSFGDLRELIISVYALKEDADEVIERLRNGGVETQEGAHKHGAGLLSMDKIREYAKRAYVNAESEGSDDDGLASLAMEHVAESGTLADFAKEHGNAIRAAQIKEWKDGCEKSIASIQKLLQGKVGPRIKATNERVLEGKKKQLKELEAGRLTKEEDDFLYAKIKRDYEARNESDDLPFGQNIDEADPRFKPIASRMDNAVVNMRENIMEQFGFTKDEADKIIRVFVQNKALKMDVGIGRYKLTHGDFWNKEVMQRALKADDKGKLPKEDVELFASIDEGDAFRVVRDGLTFKAFAGKDGVGKAFLSEVRPKEFILQAIDIFDRSEDGGANHQKKGYGTALLKEVAKYLKSVKANSLSSSNEGSGTIQMLDKVFGRANVTHTHKGEVIDFDKAKKIMDVDYGYTKSKVKIESVITFNESIDEARSPKAKFKVGDKGKLPKEDAELFASIDESSAKVGDRVTTMKSGFGGSSVLVAGTVAKDTKGRLIVKNIQARGGVVEKKSVPLTAAWLTDAQADKLQKDKEAAVKNKADKQSQENKTQATIEQIVNAKLLKAPAFAELSRLAVKVIDSTDDLDSAAKKQEQDDIRKDPVRIFDSYAFATPGSDDRKKLKSLSHDVLKQAKLPMSEVMDYGDKGGTAYQIDWDKLRNGAYESSDSDPPTPIYIRPLDPSTLTLIARLDKWLESIGVKADVIARDGNLRVRVREDSRVKILPGVNGSDVIRSEKNWKRELDKASIVASVGESYLTTAPPVAVGESVQIAGTDAGDFVILESPLTLAGEHVSRSKATGDVVTLEGRMIRRI